MMKKVAIGLGIILIGCFVWNIVLYQKLDRIQHKNKDLKRFLQYQKGENVIVQYDLGISRDSVRVLKLHILNCKDQLKKKK